MRLPFVVGLVVISTAALLWSGRSAAQTQRFVDGATLAALEARSRAEVQAKSNIETLFARLCPGRCELLGIEVQAGEAQPLDALSPGFESASPGAHEVRVDRVQVSILLDSALPADFRQNIPRLIRFRLSSLSPTVEIRAEELLFPQPQLEHMPSVAEMPPPALPDRADAELPSLEKTEEILAPQKTPFEWLAVLPWIVSLLMSVILVLALWIPLRHISRFSEGSKERVEASRDDTVKTDRRALEIDGLRDELVASRPVLNHLVRLWLQEDPAGLASLVGLVGPEIVSDLRADPELSSSLHALAAEVAAKTAPLEKEEARRVVDVAHARLSSARITVQDDALSREWSFLEAMAFPELRLLLQALNNKERSYVLTRTKATFRSTYLASISNEQRKELLRNLALEETPGRRQLLELARRVRSLAEESSFGSEVEGRIQTLIDMADTLGSNEQIEFVKDLQAAKPELALVLLRRFLIEIGFYYASEESLIEAIHRVPAELCARVIRGASKEVGARIRELLPRAKQVAVEAELGLDMRSNRAEFLAARRVFGSALVQAISENGDDPSLAGLQALEAGIKETLEAAS